MRPFACTRAATLLAVLIVCLFKCSMALAQDDAAGHQETNRPATEPDAQTEQSVDDPLTFLDAVTVTATLRAAPVQDTPGTVSVIDETTLQERLARDFADLVKYEPGVYVENNVTRLGLNGFNIRGIGGNRVLTQVDGVQTACRRRSSSPSARSACIRRDSTSMP